MFSSQHKKSNHIPPAEEKKNFDIEIMPDIFYGGKDPEIYHTPTTKKNASVVMPTETAVPPVLPAEVRTPVQKVSLSSEVVPKKKKHHAVLFFFLGGIFLLSGVSWYYISDAVKSTRLKNTPEPTAPIFSETKTPTTPAITITPSTEDSDIQQQPTSSPPIGLVFPRTTFSVSVDTDTDDLTDQEEEVFGTDSGSWDSDTDGYFDGQEVSNLYNPRGSAPKRLIDSGLVREYINPAFQYRLYYPIGWDVASVDPRSEQVLMSAITGDYIEIRTLPLPSGITFTEWFAERAIGQQFSDLRPFTNRFTIPGYVRRDGLVAYFVTDTSVIMVLYTPGTGQQIMYPHIMNMVVQSFRPSRLAVELPEQPVLPTSTSIAPSSSLSVTSTP